MRFEIAADTDRGIVKETNQDSLLVKCFSTAKETWHLQYYVTAWAAYRRVSWPVPL